MQTTTISPRDLVDGQRFSTDGGRTWHVCAVPLFGNVAVYLSERRDETAPTTRVDTPGAVLVERTDYENLSPKTLTAQYNAAPYRTRLVILAELRRRGLVR